MNKEELYGVYTVTDEEQTRKLAQKLSGVLEHGDVLCLYGELGAGKTVFAKAICEYLGVTDYVNSPTFTIVNEYDAPCFRVYHFDLYRIEDVSELYEIGFSEYLQNGGIIIMEWPDVAEELISDNAIAVKIERTFTSDDARKIYICKNRDLGKRI